LLDRLVNSSLLTISRFPDFDHFRSIESLGEARSMPLAWKDFSACSAAVTLKSCSIYLQQTFPRILQTRYHSTGAIIGFGMDDALSLVIDGAEVRSPALLLVRGDAVCEIVEPQANLVAFVKLDVVADRGWAVGPGAAKLIATQPAELATLRSVTRDILLLASDSADLLPDPRVISHVEETLLQAIDRVLQVPCPISETGRPDLSSYLRLVRQLDDFLHDNAGRTLHSAEMARNFGVSVRTLNNAVVAIRGMSMQRYTRLQRLWSVRQQLVRVPSAEAMKAVALANGFWHMGEFRTLYRDTLGETPQQTLEAARRH
jgi:AraC family transcriptional regulator, ethanolamine operon transcriptional activator